MKNIIIIFVICATGGMAFSQTGFGVDKASPSEMLDVNGWIEIGNQSAGSSGTAGAIRYNTSGIMELFNGSAWEPLVPSTTFINWGRNDCPSGSSVVYTGQAAGHHYTHHGGGAQALCLTNSPSWSGASFNDASQDAALIYGVEYQMSGYGISTFGNGLTSAQLQDYDAECAVCLVAGASETMMVPGTNTCPSGWTLRYWGYLMGDYYSGHTKSGWDCVNNSPLQTGVNSDCNGYLWYPTETELGSLQSGYVQNREMTCAVCTK